MMEEVEILDSLNHNHLYCLHYIYCPHIQNALDIYMAAWNHHPISGESNSSPIHLFVTGTHNLLKRGKVAEDFFHQIDETCMVLMSILTVLDLLVVVLLK